MKKLIKIMLITALILGILGAIFVGAGFMTGASFSDFKANGNNIDVRFARVIANWINHGNSHDWDEEEEWDDDSIDLNMMKSKDGTKALEADKVESIRVEVQAGKAEIRVISGDEIRISGLHSFDHVRYNKEEKELSVFREMKEHHSEKPLLIEIPEKKKFRELDLHVEAGEIRTFGKLSVKESSLSVEAGNLETELLDSDDSDLECSVGNLKAVFTGKLADYEVHAECDMGNFILDGEISSGWMENTFGTVGSQKTIEAENSVGNMEIAFENK